jgi:hypothetical protein
MSNTREYRFIVGPETSELPSAGTPSAPTDLVTLEYADANYVQGKAAVADLAALKAIAAADRSDKDVVFVDATRFLYAFDAASSTAGDDDLIVAPTAGTGRWYRITDLQGAIHHKDTTESSSYTAGALVLDGGLGVAKRLNVHGNVLVDGDFTVSGTTTTVNSTTLNVVDPNILVNKDGNEATANAAVSGVTVNVSDGTNGRVGYDSTTTSKFKCGPSGTESEIATLGTNQTYTGTRTFDKEFVVAELSSTPATPSSGYKKLYAKNDGKVYTKDSAGNEVEVGSGGGGGGINYITNPDAETGTTDWSSYANAAALPPTSALSGSLTSGNTFTASASSPIRGTKSFLYTKGAGASQGNGVAFDFTIDAADKSKRLSVSFDYSEADVSGTAYASGDLAVYILDVTNSTLIYPSVTSIPPTSGTITNFQVYFNATTSVSYRLYIHQATTTTGLFNFKFDNVKVGPGDSVVQMAPLGDVDVSGITYTAFGSPTVTTIAGSRRSNMVIVRGTFTCTDGTATSAKINLPSAMTVDSTKFASTLGTAVGNIYSLGAGQNFGSDNRGYVLFYDGSTTNGLFVAQSGGGGTFTKLNGSDIAISGWKFGYTFEIPIAEWAGSTVGLSNSRVEFASSTNGTWDADAAAVNTVYGTQGSIINGALSTYRNKIVQWMNPIQPTDMFQLQMSDNAGVSFFNVPGGGPYGNTINVQNRSVTALAGVLIQHTAINQTTVLFNQYMNVREDGTSPGAWGTGGTAYWRLVKSSNPLSIGTPTTLKYQRKIPSWASIGTGTGNIPDLSFTQLTPGQTYKYTYSLQTSIGGGSSHSLGISVDENSNILLEQRRNSSVANNSYEIMSGEVIFVATGTTLNMNLIETQSGYTYIYGIGLTTAGKANSWAMLEELPYNIATTQWT